LKVVDVVDFTRRFMHIEEALALFPDTRVAPPGWWDIVRHDVMKMVYARVVDAAPEPAEPPAFATRLLHLAIRRLLGAALSLSQQLRRHDVLVYRAPRLRRNGRGVDTAMDQVLATCPGRALVINTFPHRYDRRFAKASELAPRPAGLDALEQRLREDFGVSVDLDHFVRNRLADHELAWRQYRRLLARVRPRLILLTQNGVDKALFRAAREAGVPCVEVQHGLISEAHPAYAYPESVSGAGAAMFPDGLLAFSEFWIRNCHYPVRWAVAAGNDEFVPTALPAPRSNGDVLVITAAKYNERVSDWTERIAARRPDRTFKFKLHPSQGHQLTEVKARFQHLPNVEVIGTNRTTSQLLATASDVLLIQSTVAYEAVQAGRRLLVIDELDSSTHHDLFALPNVFLVQDLDGLERALSLPQVSAPAPVFFKPFDAALARDVLARGGPSPGDAATFALREHRA
jgi:hypothetical protein